MSQRGLYPRRRPRNLRSCQIPQFNLTTDYTNNTDTIISWRYIRPNSFTLRVKARNCTLIDNLCRSKRSVVKNTGVLSSASSCFRLSTLDSRLSTFDFRPSVLRSPSEPKIYAGNQESDTPFSWLSGFSYRGRRPTSVIQTDPNSESRLPRPAGRHQPTKK